MVNASGTNDAYIKNKVMQGGEVVSAIRAIMSIEGLSLDCARLLQ